ncbi:hypothetical protein FKM82_006562 [Ascaphus truei]
MCPSSKDGFLSLRKCDLAKLKFSSHTVKTCCANLLCNVFVVNPHTLLYLYFSYLRYLFLAWEGKRVRALTRVGREKRHLLACTRQPHKGYCMIYSDEDNTNKEGRINV